MLILNKLRACLARRVISVLLVLLDLVDHLDLAVRRAIWVQWVSLVTKVNPVFLATLEYPVSKVAKVNLVFLVSVDLDSPASPAKGVRRVFPDFRANPVLKDLPDLLDIPETNPNPASHIFCQRTCHLGVQVVIVLA